MGYDHNGRHRHTHRIIPLDQINSHSQQEKTNQWKGLSIQNQSQVPVFIIDAIFSRLFAISFQHALHCINIIHSVLPSVRFSSDTECTSLYQLTDPIPDV